MHLLIPFVSGSFGLIARLKLARVFRLRIASGRVVFLKELTGYEGTRNKITKDMELTALSHNEQGL